MLGYKLVVFQHDDCLLIEVVTRCSRNAFATSFLLTFTQKNQQQLQEDAPLRFWNMLLELNQADRTISLHPTKAFYQQLLGRYSFEDAKGGETPTLQLDHDSTKKSENKLGCCKIKALQHDCGRTGLAEQAKTRHSFCCSSHSA